MDKLKRDIRINVRLSLDEWEKLVRLQEVNGKTTSQWIRDRIRNARLIDKGDV